jgi:cysteine desulfurase / selenocysteine lyase
LPISPALTENLTPQWEDFRRRMPVAQRWAYLDHAAVAPLSGPAATLLADWSREAAEDGATPYGRWMERIEATRHTAARMIGADPAEVALVRNTTEGIGLVAEGFPWQPGDNVVLRDDEFPSNVYPWMNLADRGVETRRVPTDGGRLDGDRLAAACDGRTRIIALSWVAYSNGWRHDVARVARLAHDQGALLFLDAIQALGVFPLDVRQTGVDFLAADGHKWLLGPEGAGVFFVRREHLERLRPLGVGWNSVVHSHDFNHIELSLKPAAERYEGGSPNTAGLLALGESLDLLMEFGMAAIAQRVLDLTDLACARLGQLGATILSDRRDAHRSGIVSFELPGRDPKQVQAECLKQGVVLSCRSGRLRISPHAYNDQSDIERLVDAIRR